MMMESNPFVPVDLGGLHTSWMLWSASFQNMGHTQTTLLHYPKTHLWSLLIMPSSKVTTIMDTHQVPFWLCHVCRLFDTLYIFQVHAKRWSGHLEGTQWSLQNIKGDWQACLLTNGQHMLILSWSAQKKQETLSTNARNSRSILKRGATTLLSTSSTAAVWITV